MNIVDPYTQFPAAGGVPCIVVAGAGAPEFDGTYTERGIHDGKPYYNVFGQPNDPFASSIVNIHGELEQWRIYNSAGSSSYQCTQNVATPDLGTAWGGTIPPIPTVTAGFLP